jgi:hypothetical protein
MCKGKIGGAAGENHAPSRTGDGQVRARAIPRNGSTAGRAASPANPESRTPVQMGETALTGDALVVSAGPDAVTSLFRNALSNAKVAALTWLGTKLWVGPRLFPRPARDREAPAPGQNAAVSRAVLVCCADEAVIGLH